MYKKEKMGLRCRICTGCGRCVGKEIRILADAPLQDNPRDDDNGAGDLWGFGAGKFEGVIAADIGTTTIAMVLYGGEGETKDRFVCVNPQVEYGADVISRIQAAQDGEKAERMRLLVRGVLEQGVERFRKSAAPGQPLRMVIAANTTMVYLLMGWDTAELGRAPFKASRLGASQTQIAGADCFVLPGLSAFVGGDITAGIYACGMTRCEKPVLLIDLGTNGEMALGSRHRITACSTAAGPAFEGGVNKGIWGADMVSFTAKLRREGLVDETGLLIDEYFHTGIRIGDVCVTQQSIRALQLAKGAIAAGIEILTGAYGISPEEIHRVVLAGGFGYYLKPEDAVCIGLLPPALLEKTVAGGNTALAGARLAGAALKLQKNGKRISEKIFPEQTKIEIINLAEAPDFEKRYLEAINLK